jgi:hypothetical protein
MIRSAMFATTLVALLLAGCTGARRAPYGPVPSVENPPATSLVRVQSVAHWDALAARLVDGIRPGLHTECYPDRCRMPLRVDVPADTPFATALRTTLRTRLAATGDLVDTAGASQALPVRVDIQALRFGLGRRTPWRPESSRDDFADEVRHEGGRTPRLEIVVTATVERAGRIVARAQQIVYAREEDAALYEQRPGSLADTLRVHEQRRLKGEAGRLSDDLSGTAWND